jgi:RNA polymerase-binding transcription factor DksA
MSTEPYTPAEQEEFRTLVQARLEGALKDLELLNLSLDLDQDAAESASQTEGEAPLSKAQKEGLILRQEKFIQTLRDARERIDNNVYGMCRATGKRIPPERLRLLPWVTLSIEARQIKN